MSELIKICGGALVAAVCAFIVKGSGGSERGVVLISLSVLLGTVLSRLITALSPLNEMVNESGMGAYASVMLKCLGICLIVKTVSDICSGLNQESLAGAVTLCGKAEILVLCLPIIKGSLESIRELLN